MDLYINNDSGTIFGHYDTQDKFAYIESLTVDFQCRRHGVGTQLFQQFMTKLDVGVQLVYLEVFKHNFGAMKFWQQLGFLKGDLVCPDYIEYQLPL